MAINRRQFLVQNLMTLASLTAASQSARSSAVRESGLSDIFKHDFALGTALSNRTLEGHDSAMLDLVAREFKAITAENAMKWEELHPADRQWNWDSIDRFVEFGKANDMLMAGHTLIWHHQIPDSVFFDRKGRANKRAISKTRLLARMKNHISTVVDRYKGAITLWDVVNEAVNYDHWRQSHWHSIIGPEYLDHAFRFTEEADPKAQLIYNDFSMTAVAKQDFIIKKIQAIRKRGVKIDGIGLQCHVLLDSDAPSIKALETTIIKYAQAGLRVHITELDVDVLPFDNKGSGADLVINREYSPERDPYRDGLPLAISSELANRYAELFRLFVKHKEHIDRVSFWCTSDDESWKNDWPVKGRKNYPLLFDRDRQAKQAYYALRNIKLD